MARISLLLVLVGFAGVLNGQVLNNNIQNRTSLQPGAEPIFSTTAGSTVEWKCINKALTKKCLVYHNDQWFDFMVSTPGTYYINISSQKCRDKQGIQLIVIEGNPCQTQTYRIINCVSQLRREDAFVTLDSLKADTQYLLNVDGFLSDYCEFEIQLSDKPKGLPPGNIRETTISKADRKGPVVNLSWVVEENIIDQFQSFKVYRDGPNGSKFINEQPVSMNSYGAHVLSYTATDTLGQQGTFKYRILAVHRLTMVSFLLGIRVVEYKAPKEQQRSVLLDLAFEDKAPIKILVYDQVSQAMLKKVLTIFDPSIHRSFEVNLGEYLDQGIKRFMILVSDADPHHAKEFYFSLNGQGRLVPE